MKVNIFVIVNFNTLRESLRKLRIIKIIRSNFTINSYSCLDGFGRVWALGFHLFIEYLNNYRNNLL